MNIEISKFVKDFELLLDEVEAGSISPETKFRDLEEWSSLIALTVIAMVDEEYDVKLSGDDIRTSVTVKDLFDKISMK
ncbi:acyl carrier protein [Flavobacterium sp. HJJ]|uniref:acyl carrier protein n=1 Tax=Flavobacterium sp. HJJ TaxID=2783792 RepID=UPI00188C3A16|nr:phosphopantetheine-binding protein [Flavobacterium sp. HJJ]MBF4470288.1 acyl carrier protein [Flavobacterium sp. HJJ]